VLATPLFVLFAVGILLALFFHPKLPTTFLDWAGGLLLLSGALSFGSFLAGCMIRGAGGEVLPAPLAVGVPAAALRLDTNDAIILPTKPRR